MVVEELAEGLLAVNEILIGAIDNLYEQLAKLCDHYPDEFADTLVAAQKFNYEARKRLLELEDE